MTVQELLAGLQHLPRDLEVLAFEPADASISRSTAGLIRAGASRDGLPLRGAGAGRKAWQEQGGSTAEARMAYLLPVAQL
jgi:hypothetical protein